MQSLIGTLKNMLVSKQEFSRLEKAILQAVREKMPQHILARWDMQVAAVNKIQRLQGLEVDLYVMKNGKPNFPKELAFSDKSEDFHLATVDITDSASHKLRANVWCVAGHLFMLKYVSSFKEFEGLAQGEWQVHCHIENYPA
jgi:hypothetical protein